MSGCNIMLSEGNLALRYISCTLCTINFAKRNYMFAVVASSLFSRPNFTNKVNI